MKRQEPLGPPRPEIRKAELLGRGQLSCPGEACDPEEIRKTRWRSLLSGLSRVLLVLRPVLRIKPSSIITIIIYQLVFSQLTFTASRERACNRIEPSSTLGLSVLSLVLSDAKRTDTPPPFLPVLSSVLAQSTGLVTPAPDNGNN